MAGDTEPALAERIAALLAGAGARGSVQHLQRLSGGASRETWSLDLVSEDVGTRPLILQRLRRGTISGGPGMTGEAALIAAAGALGVPVPTVVTADDGDGLGAPCLVMERLDGETIARKLLRDPAWSTARAGLVAQAGAALAAIHRIDPSVAPALRHDDQLQSMTQLLHGFDQPLPAFELALRWLEAHQPDPTEPTVVHGDFRLGNLLVSAEGLRGVLDWELAHLGDPAEDLGWYCVRAWRFGSALPAGGMGTREELLEAYRAAGGRPIEAATLRWWEVLGTLKWGLICVLQSQAHLSGMARSVELAAIGRRVCENEWDVLTLLPGGDLQPPPQSQADSQEQPIEAAAAPPSLYGRPTGAELLEAVREWVERDVGASGDPRLAFHARVAAKALQVVERELAMGAEHEAAHRSRLASLGCDDDHQLAARVRAGDFDHRADEVRAAVAESVRAKLAVANPRWLLADSG